MQSATHQKTGKPAVDPRHQCPEKRQNNPSGRGSCLTRCAAIVSVLLVVGNAHAKDPGTPTAEHLGLTPAYLQGDWCNTHIQFPNTRSPENRNYRFAADGSFAAQPDPASEMKPGLVYRYRPQGKIGMDNLLYQVKSVQPGDFVLHIAVNDLHFHRGACK